MVFAKINVSGTSASVEFRKVIPVGLIGGEVAFEFMDPTWDSLDKFVVFEGCCTTRTNPLKGDVAIIPSEVVSHEGAVLKVGVFGVNTDKTVGIPTFWANLGKVRDAADPHCDPATDPTLPMWAELKKEVDDLKENGLDVNKESIEEGVQEYLRENPPVQFETDKTLILEDGILRVNTTNVVEEDNTLPVTSAAVQVVVGNIGAILDTI